MDLTHDTVVLERRFDASAAQIFAAYADPAARAAWSAPAPGTRVVIDTCEFRPGGQETARCGPEDDLKWGLAVIYHDIVEDSRIVFTEELSEGDMRLTLALVSFEIEDEPGGGALVRVTDQVTSFVGAEGIEGHAEGYRSILDNLTAWLRKAA